MPTEDPVHFHLVGAKDFVRHNPMSDRFEVRRFHSIEFWCADATNTYKRFQHGLGMTLVAKSDLSTENEMCASFVLQSNDLVFAFTAPYARKVQRNSTVCPLPGYDLDTAYNFVNDHGLGVRAVSACPFSFSPSFPFSPFFESRIFSAAHKPTFQQLKS